MYLELHDRRVQCEKTPWFTVETAQVSILHEWKTLLKKFDPAVSTGSNYAS
jgi:hypothetical protein